MATKREDIEKMAHIPSGREISKTRRKSIGNELGDTGLKFQGMDVYEEIERKLTGVRGAKVYNEMVLNDPLVGGVLYSVESLLLNVRWRVEPASNDSQDKEWAQFIVECMGDMSNSWNETMRQVISFLKYGFSYHEICYKYRNGGEDVDDELSSKYEDGKIGWAKLPIRSQESILEGGWYIDKHGKIMGAKQVPPHRGLGVDIPIEKALHFRTTTVNNNPEGRSLLRSAFFPYWKKKNIEAIEAIGIERNLSGVPVIGAPISLFSKNKTPAETDLYNRLISIVTNLRNDEQAGVLLPEAYDENGNKLFTLSLLSAPGKDTQDTSKVITRYATEIAISMLADFVLLGQTGTGTQALASEKIDVFTTALQSWLSVIKEEFNKRAIPRLLKLNGFKGKEYPRLEHGDITTKSVNDFMANLRNLAVTGLNLFPDHTLETFVRDRMGLPEISKEEADERDEKVMQIGKEPKNNGGDAIPHGDTSGGVALARPKKPRLKNRELSTNGNKRNGVNDG